MFKNSSQLDSFYTTITVLIIVVVSCIPLFFNLPYRDNIFLSWEGAYRMYSGQFPFRDFGIPLGYGYWLLPYISFLVFGPNLISLVKIQVLINIVSGLSFYRISKSFSEDKDFITSFLNSCSTFTTSPTARSVLF